MSAPGQSPAEILAEWRRTRRGPGRIPNHIKAIIAQLEGDRNPPPPRKDELATTELAPPPMVFSAPVIQEQAIIGLPQDALEQQASSEPPAKFRWVSKTVAENAAAKASQWNAQLLRQRRDRGPFYVDPHTRAVQVVSSWVVPLVIPSNWDELAKEQRAEQERQERILSLLKEEAPQPPKQPVTAFFHYSNAQRATIKAKYPALGLTEIARIAGDQWRVMDDSERYHWERIAEDDRRRYNEEMKAHRLRIEERNRLLIEMTPQLDLNRSSATLPANDAAEQKRLKVIQRRMNDPDPMCELCHKGKKQLPEELLHCRQCWHRFHPSCLELPAESVQKIAEINDWRCSDCKVCEICRGPGNEDKLLFCDSCDRGTHTFCLKPPLARPPAGGWRCAECVMCKSCNAKAPGTGAHSRWHADYTLCDACYQLFQDYKYCPICMKVYRHNEKTPMVQCDSCNWWVHASCDNMSQEQYEALSKDGAAAYTCPKCRSGDPPLWKRDDSDANRRRIRDGQDEVVFDQQLRRFVQKAKPPPDPSKPPDFSVNAFYVRPASHKRGAAAAARAAAEQQAAMAKEEFGHKVKELEAKRLEEEAKEAKSAPAASPAKRKATPKQEKKPAKTAAEEEEEELDEAAAMLQTQPVPQPVKRGRGRPRKDASNAASSTRKKRPNYRELDEDDLDDEDEDEQDSYGASDSEADARASRKRTRRGGRDSDEENTNSRERPRRRGRE